jgi:Na+-translocating ferredoxin:NAD+ oxidoreductase subunit C
MAAPAMADAPMELPCVRCGDCIPACPVGLDPQQLHMRLRAGQDEAAARLGLADCTACAACDAACPSHIALSNQFRAGRDSLVARATLMEQAVAARARFEQRGQRLARELEDRKQRDLELARQADSGDAVAAALERAKARRRPGTSE